MKLKYAFSQVLRNIKRFNRKIWGFAIATMRVLQADLTFSSQNKMEIRYYTCTKTSASTDLDLGFLRCHRKVSVYVSVYTHKHTENHIHYYPSFTTLTVVSFRGAIPSAWTACLRLGKRLKPKLSVRFREETIGFFPVFVQDILRMYILHTRIS